MKKFLLSVGVAGAALFLPAAAQAEDLPAYGDLYNVEWCPCNPEEPFDADGSVVMGKTVMCPCSGMYSGYKKGFDEDIRDIKRAAANQIRKFNYYKYYIGADYNLNSTSPASDRYQFDDIHFATPMQVDLNNIIDDQDSISVVLGARFSKYIGLEAFYQQTYDDNTTTQIDNHTLNAGGTGHYLVNEFTTKYKAYGVDLVGYMPLSQYFDIVGSVGIGKYDFQNEAKFSTYLLSNDNFVESFNQKFNEDKIAWRAAIGGQINVTEGVALRAMYRYISIGGDVIDDMSEVSMGIRFLF